MNLNVKFKKLHPEAVLPIQTEGNAGMDLTCVSKTYNPKYGFNEYGTGLAMELPDMYVGLIFQRSSVSKTFQSLANAVGVIDYSYKGELLLRFFNNVESLAYYLAEINVVNKSNRFESISNTVYNVGDRVAQLIILPYPKVKTEWTDELSESDRGSLGFGSSGV